MSRKRILVVDDDQEFTRFVHAALTTRGNYDVREENEGKRALNAAREFHPHLILLDVNMPYVPGDLIASLIREDRELHNIPIIYVTALIKPEESEDKELGQNLMLSKPVQVEKLLECIRLKLEEAHSEEGL